MDEICVICAENYTSSLRAPVECPKCNFKCCKECIKTSSLHDKDPMCLNNDCRAFFPDYFLRDLTSNFWMRKTYNPHRAEVLLNRQIALIPDTMIHVDTYKRNIELNIELSKLKKEMNEMVNQYEKKIRKVERKIKINNGQSFEKKTHTTFVKKCIKNDCEGYLNHSYKCTTCNTYVCSKCFTIKEEGHVCNEDDLKTAELIKSDTKPCPGCHTHIHKIEGCDQMYCPPCKTAFSWKTGKIVTGVIHNPHYFEELQKNNNLEIPHQDIPCGGIPYSPEYSRRLNKISPKVVYKNSSYTSNLSHWLFNLLMFTRHIREIEIKHLDEMNVFSTHLKDRIKYIIGDIDQKHFKKTLVQKEKQYFKQKEYNEIFETFANLLEEIIRKIMNDKTIQNEMELLNVYNETKTIIEYVNEYLLTVSKRYNCVRKMVHYYEPKYYDGKPLSDKYMRVFNVLSNI